MKDEMLLPCPFCGGKAEFDHDDYNLIWISCSACGISTDTAYHSGADARETLRDVWSRRAIQSGNSGKPVTVPAGYVLVPVEFTPEMRNAWDSAPNNSDDDNVNMMAAYHAMLAAAPKPHDVPKAKNIIGHYQGADGKEQDIITLAANKGV